ncbi:unnamed protein product [Chrysodeixis includens]|uniref:Uncharacterized protein n=1 Tax=Chrysodeixis includens TaxID=689277 RepID=A0A9N8PYN6_CHRIL|nr:unnamed protein product [Chrysodeixis includens]
MFQNSKNNIFITCKIAHRLELFSARPLCRRRRPQSASGKTIRTRPNYADVGWGGEGPRMSAPSRPNQGLDGGTGVPPSVVEDPRRGATFGATGVVPVSGEEADALYTSASINNAKLQPAGSQLAGGSPRSVHEVVLRAAMHRHKNADDVAQWFRFSQ